MLLPPFEKHFPKFARFIQSGRADPVDKILPPASIAEIEAEEASLEVPLPLSYKTFLQISRGVLLQGGALQMESGHPFFHCFPPLEQLTPQQRLIVSRRSANWPPPSEGMLCFAEFFLESDGDQALFDVSLGLVDGEYPVFYYNHEQPSVRKLADSFGQFLEEIVAGG